jgi:hypothetical protein
LQVVHIQTVVGSGARRGRAGATCASGAAMRAARGAVGRSQVGGGKGGGHIKGVVAVRVV